ncbi:acetyl-CoA acetyltransferase [Cohnella nanjingensis]|uniref:Acetyl-CoA acetyltransferase n=1 Tax=Cohnella nanjingensis TaxID=1387779 RepID=A0A7X0RPN6_9BACL|nr:acetyl-CoA acetyltransferase [Cohnella nanjingensis]MBB6669949.1 acetyl-CoA acetyltransferase [Cohnella nanjingensis]
MSSKAEVAGVSSPMYQAEQEWVGRVKKMRQKLSGIGNSCVNRPVRVETIDGHAYEGTVVGCDGCHLHLRVNPTPQDVRFFGPLAAGSILTLVLYELLVITLLI